MAPPLWINTSQCCSIHNLYFITRRTRHHILLVIDINWYKRYQFCYSKQHYKHYGSACTVRTSEFKYNVLARLSRVFALRVWSFFWTLFYIYFHVAFLCFVQHIIFELCTMYIRANTYDEIDKPIKTILQCFTLV